MRRIRYSVATSLDGFIAGLDGESDRTVTDPGIDFRADGPVPTRPPRPQDP